jgi:hypothetical protein
MSFAAVLLAPFVLTYPSMGTLELRDLHTIPAAAAGEVPPERSESPPGDAPKALQGWLFTEVAESFRVQAQNQVRIEQHMTIRIAPLSRPVTAPPRFMFDMPEREMSQRFIERNIGRCLPVGSISGVQPDRGSRLILFLRDRRMISAVLERACRARDFYSGFYVERTADGRLCVDRDTLQSRTGANCKLTRIRQIVDADE